MTSQSSGLYLGAISGTSMDGLDLALLNMQTTPPQLIVGDTVQMDPQLRESLNNLALGNFDNLDALGRADTALGRSIGEAIIQFLSHHNLSANQIVAIGSHGQTVRHRPDADNPFTLQIGDPNIIAEITGLPVVADFRRRDMAAGGQAAPLVPGFHELMFRTSHTNRVIVNIGGISNITLLSQHDEDPVIGFDTGPGNALMDGWIQKQRAQSYDSNGAWAAGGHTDQELMQLLLADDFLSGTPPKSTGREHYNLAWLDEITLSMAHSISAQNVQTTLTEFTARTVAEAVQRWAYPTGELIVCGGGRHNSLLMTQLQTHISQYKVVPCEELNIEGDWIEAAAFAWLACLRFDARPGNIPSVTGARGKRVLGAVYSPD